MSNETIDSQITVGLTPRALTVLGVARREADMMGHNFVGVEHLLLGISKLGQGIASLVLHSYGAEPESVRCKVVELNGPGPRTVSPEIVGFTSEVIKVCRLAKQEAEALKLPFIGVEHLLLGILKAGPSGAIDILRSLNIGPDFLMENLIQEIAPDGEGIGPTPKVMSPGVRDFLCSLLDQKIKLFTGDIAPKVLKFYAGVYSELLGEEAIPHVEKLFQQAGLNSLEERYFGSILQNLTGSVPAKKMDFLGKPEQ